MLKYQTHEKFRKKLEIIDVSMQTKIRCKFNFEYNDTQLWNRFVLNPGTWTMITDVLLFPKITRWKCGHTSWLSLLKLAIDIRSQESIIDKQKFKIIRLSFLNTIISKSGLFGTFVPDLESCTSHILTPLPNHFKYTHVV